MARIDIFNEYIRMRQNGLDTKEALKALRVFVETLPKAEKESLAQDLRTWERENSHEHRTVEVQTINPNKPAPELTSDTNVWIECPNCRKRNRMTEIFCYSCGNLLEPPTQKTDTAHFADSTDNLFSDEYFGDESVLTLLVRDTGDKYEIRPQLRRHEVIVGRNAGNGTVPPDVDLANANASELGVSRLHLAIRYEGNDNTIHVYDLGSSNGSFINGQKLHPKEVRILRHNDELRLGRLVLRVTYQHPGEKIK